MRILHVADAETAGGPGGAPAKAVETGKSALEQQITKLFPEDADAGPEPKPEAAKQPEPKGTDETIDLSQENEDGRQPVPTDEEAKEAKAAGMTVEQYRTALTEEKGRTDAIAAKTGETLEQIYARETQDGKLTDLESAGAKKTFSQEELEGVVQKRLKKLSRENEDLKRQLEERPAAETPDTFESAEAGAQSGIDRVDDLFDTLRSEPEKVEAELRKMMGANAPAEMTPEYMRGVLRRTKRGLEGQLHEVTQKRQAFTAERQGVEKLMGEPEVVKAAPFVADEDSEEHGAWQQLRKSPQLKNHPRGDYLAAALILGMRQLKPAIQQLTDRRAGRKPAATNGHVKLKIRSKMPGTGAAAAGGKQGRMSMAQAKAKGDPEAMAAAMDL